MTEIKFDTKESPEMSIDATGYKVLCKETIIDLEDAVRECMLDGWVLVGEAHFRHPARQGNLLVLEAWYQTMVKRGDLLTK